MPTFDNWPDKDEQDRRQAEKEHLLACLAVHTCQRFRYNKEAIAQWCRDKVPKAEQEAKPKKKQKNLSLSRAKLAFSSNSATIAELQSALNHAYRNRPN